MNAADMAKELADFYGLKYATQVNLEAAIGNLMERGVPPHEIKTFAEDILDTLFDFEIPTGSIEVSTGNGIDSSTGLNNDIELDGTVV